MRKRPLLIVEDEPELRKVLSENLMHNGYSVQAATNAEEGLQFFSQKKYDLVISDIRLPGQNGLQLLETIKEKSLHTPVILMTGFGTIDNAVEAMKKGAFHYFLKPFSLKNMEKMIESALLGSDPENETEPFSLAPASGGSSILSRNRKIGEILRLCQKIAGSKATVLLQGESGTGKELFARYIHSQSPRNQGPFVAVNCASLPETLLESELFGHEKGAFTGAIGRKIGKFELAQHGTILLDEISEMNTFLQAKILRVLQENEVDRIGGSHPIPIDIRVIATTNRNLKACIEKGEFREDLYYRLNVIDLTLPPLRERTEDIELLADYFLKKFSADYKKSKPSISEKACGWLKKQEWRGNVRELKNTLERAVLISSHSVLEVEDLAVQIQEAPAEEIATEPSSSLSLREMEQKLIYQALEKTSGNRTHAAKILGISIRTLRNKLNEYKMGVVSEEIS
jgi:DNA-binding NtrC family response regulator